VVGAGSPFVRGIVIVTLATWFTVWIRDGRAFGLCTGGRINVAISKVTPAQSAQITNGGFLFFIRPIPEYLRITRCADHLLLFKAENPTAQSNQLQVL